jgi:AbrB family looped-hinge helix DNA binding protein
MPLVKVRRAGQITLPAELREQFVLEEGTYLEAEAVPGGILLKPVAIVERAKARQDLRDILDRVHAKQPPTSKTPLEQEEEIAEMIKDFRREHTPGSSLTVQCS